MPFDVTKFGLAEMLRLGIDIRKTMATRETFESAAQSVCEHLYHDLTGPTGDRACALVRCYKTHPFAELPLDLKDFAKVSLPSETPRPSMKCLTLMGTVGDEPEWNSRSGSRGHKAIPLPSPEIVEQAPMIAQLLRQFGLDLSELLDPGKEVVRDLMGKTYGVFHVADARGSRFIPAQEEFVLRHGIRSVLGFGGSLATSDLFAVILFSKFAIPESSADRFRTVALDVKSGFFKLREAVFAA
ncbi:MAG: hypothetical protein H0W63_11525 [Gemmatimonadaceae bacterium]|nr:hypothetical protein [Gemmatimonadaceae bacterium]